AASESVRAARSARWSRPGSARKAAACGTVPAATGIAGPYCNRSARVPRAPALPKAQYGSRMTCRDSFPAEPPDVLRTHPKAHSVGTLMPSKRDCGTRGRARSFLRGSRWKCDVLRLREAPVRAAANCGCDLKSPAIPGTSCDRRLRQTGPDPSLDRLIAIGL